MEQQRRCASLLSCTNAFHSFTRCSLPASALICYSYFSSFFIYLGSSFAMRHISAFTVPSFLSIFAFLASAQASPKPTECSAFSGDATSTLAARCTPQSVPPLATSSQSPDNREEKAKQDLSLTQQLFLASRQVFCLIGDLGLAFAFIYSCLLTNSKAPRTGLLFSRTTLSLCSTSTKPRKAPAMAACL